MARQFRFIVFSYLVVWLTFALPSEAVATLLFGPSIIAPVQLPLGFTAYAGAKSNGAYIVAGQYQGSAAFLTITPLSDGSSAVSAISTLPSLNQAAGANGSHSGVVYQIASDESGGLIFVGASMGPASLTAGGGTASVWDISGNVSALPFAATATGNDISEARDISQGGTVVGGVFGSAAVSDSSGFLVPLPKDAANGAGNANAISPSGTTIGGAQSGRAALWVSSASGYNILTTSDPSSLVGYSAGYTMANNWLVGAYTSADWDGDIVGAIWDTSDGSLVQDLVSMGPLDSVFPSVSGVVNGVAVAIFNRLAEFGGAFALLEGSSEPLPLSSLFQNAGLVFDTSWVVTDVFEGSLGLVLSSSSGAIFAPFSASSTGTQAQVPEPTATAMLLLTGLASLSFRRRTTFRGKRLSA